MLLTVKKAAERACVSASLVYQWCKQKILPHRRVGIRGRRGKILIDPIEFDNFLDGFRVLPPEAPRPKEVKPSLVLKHLRLA